jgi:hypothetical protein
MPFSTSKIVIVVVLMLVGGGAVLYLGHRGNQNGQPAAFEIAPEQSAVHTADWYVAHPDVLHQDEKRCAGDAATLSPAACQNVASADARLNVIEMQNAAAVNASAASHSGQNSKP